MSFSTTQLQSINIQEMWRDEKLFPYKIKMQQDLHEANTVRRVDFCGDLEMFLEENPAVPQCIYS
jgi:hypothetical protein